MIYHIEEQVRRLWYLLAAVLFLISFMAVQGQSYMINEIAPVNEHFADEYGEFDDWIELYNGDENPVWLDEVYLTDDFDEPLKWKIDGPYKMQPGGFLILWLDGQTHQGAFQPPIEQSAGAHGRYVIRYQAMGSC